MNKLIKPAKQALAQKYGYRNVSVKNGDGTAWGWVMVHIKTDKPADCTGDNYTYCQKCIDVMHNTSVEAKQIMNKVWAQQGMKPYTYTSDDGYGSASKEVLVSVSFHTGFQRIGTTYA